MIKLKDFAAERGVTDRQVQRLLKKYEAELEGKFERRGQNGTWLTDEACEILIGKMKTNPVVVGDGEQYREMQRLKAEKEKLELENQHLHEALEMLNQKLVAALEREVEQTKQIAEADAKKLLLEERAATAQCREEEQRQRAEAAEAELNQYQPWAFGLYRKK